MSDKHGFGFNTDGKDINFKADDRNVNGAMSDARTALGLDAFKQNNDHELRNVAIAGVAGFGTGAALTGAGEVALMKTIEPIARPIFALGMSVLGGGRGYSAVMNAPKLTALECLTPKPILIGGAIAAGLTIGAYELYKHAFSHEE